MQRAVLGWSSSRCEQTRVAFLIRDANKATCVLLALDVCLRSEKIHDPFTHAHLSRADCVLDTQRLRTVYGS